MTFHTASRMWMTRCGADFDRTWFDALFQALTASIMPRIPISATIRLML